jgi:hypothetical protein
MNYPSKRDFENPDDFYEAIGQIEDAADQERDRLRDESVEMEEEEDL